MTYARRYIDVTFSKGGGGTLKFNARGKYALRTVARIEMAGGWAMGTLALELYGLSLAHINELSTYGTRVHPNYNYKVTVEAGDDENGMSVVFVGGIQQAWGDMRAMPNVPFRVIAAGGGSAAAMKADPSSYEGPTPVPTILEPLAKKAGLTFQNNGVNTKIADPYFWGSPWKQIKECIDAGNCEGFIDREVLAIWPKSGNRQGDSLIISPQTGMRDYPAFTEYGVQVRTEFKRAIDYGQLMTIQNTDIKPAAGTWRIVRIDYDLQANVPRGQWFVILDGVRTGAPVTQR